MRKLVVQEVGRRWLFTAMSVGNSMILELHHSNLVADLFTSPRRKLTTHDFDREG
jgi:hypothetical protein